MKLSELAVLEPVPHPKPMQTVFSTPIICLLIINVLNNNNNNNNVLFKESVNSFLCIPKMLCCSIAKED